MPSTHSPTPSPRSRLLETLPRFAVVMTALLALAAFPQSALFSVERVQVNGATTIAPAVLMAMAGIEPGGRLFAVDTALALRRLLAEPRISSADVRLRPPGTVVLRITERRPVAALTAEGRYALIADDLVVVAVGSDRAGLPLVIESNGRQMGLRPGAVVTSSATRAALDALSVLPDQLAGDLDRVVVGVGLEFTFVLASGLQVRAGGPSALAERLARVPAVLAALRARGIEPAALDLRYAGSIAVTTAPKTPSDAPPREERRRRPPRVE